MDNNEYRKFQDDIFQKIRDLEDVAKKKAVEQAFQTLLRAVKPLADAAGVDAAYVVKVMFSKPESFIEALSEAINSK